MSRMFRPLSLALLLAAFASAQTPTHSLLVSLEGAGARTLTPGGLWLNFVDDQEILIVTPDANAPYSARKFHTTAALRATMGDSLGTGAYADGDPAGEVDMAFLPITTTLTAPVRFSDLWISFNNTKPAAPGSGITTIDEGDVVQFLPGGAIIKRITRPQILTLTGLASTAAVDVDAMTLDAAGNLYYSDSQNSPAVQDGGLWQLPAGTWSTAGGATPSSALVVVTEAEMSAKVSAATSGAFLNVNDLTGIDLDPNGGTFTATRRTYALGVGLTTFDVVQLPNFIFCCKSVPGCVLSTANGGSLAVINGVTMGGPFPGATSIFLGPAVGVQSGNASYTNDLGLVAVVPYRPAPLVADYRNSSAPAAPPLGVTPTPGALVVEVGDTAPFGYVNLLLTAEFGLVTPPPAGGRCPSFPLAGFDYDDLYLTDPTDLLFLYTFGNPDWIFQTNQHGYAQTTITIPPGLSGMVVCIQPLEVSPGLRLGSPAIVQFQ